MKRTKLLLLLPLFLTGCFSPDSADDNGKTNDENNNINNNDKNQNNGDKIVGFFDKEDMNSIIYYSYLYHREGFTTKSEAPKNSLRAAYANDKNEKLEDTQNPETDVILYDFGPGPYTYYGTVHFTFDLNDPDTFLATKIGTGKIETIVSYFPQAFSEHVITFRNTEDARMFSCLKNGVDEYGMNFISGKQIYEHYVRKDYREGAYSYWIKNDHSYVAIDDFTNQIQVDSGSYYSDDDTYTVSIEEIEEFAAEYDSRGKKFDINACVDGVKCFDTIFDKDVVGGTINNESLKDAFKFENGVYSLVENPNKLPAIKAQLFFADINADGHDDICYTYNLVGASGSYTHDVIIYDYFNKQTLYRNLTTSKDEILGTSKAKYFRIVNGKLALSNSLQYLYATGTSKENYCIEKDTFFVANGNSPTLIDVPRKFNILRTSLSLVGYDKETGKYDWSAMKYYANTEYFLCLDVSYEGQYNKNTCVHGDCVSFASVNEGNFKINFKEYAVQTIPWVDFYYSVSFIEAGRFTITASIGGINTTISIEVLDQPENTNK